MIKDLCSCKFGNGTRVDKTYAEIGNDKVVQKMVFLPKDSILKQAGIDYFYKIKCTNPELSVPITACNYGGINSAGIKLASGTENVRNLIKAVKKSMSRLK